VEVTKVELATGIPVELDVESTKKELVA